MTDHADIRNEVDTVVLDDADLESTAQTAAPIDGTPPTAARPRTRWAGIVWGLVFAMLAGAGIWLASGDGRIDDLAAWVRGLSAASVIAYALLAVGAVLLVTGLVGLLRRAQRALAARSQ